MRLLAIDPGKANGLALLDTKQDRVLRNAWTVRGVEKLYAELDECYEPGLTIVAEDYVNRPPQAGGFDHHWDKGFTHRVIGAIEHWAWSNKLGIVTLQQPSIKPAMYGLVGLKYVKGAKNMHHIDAAVHGFKFLWDRKIIPQKEILNCMSGVKV